MTGDLTALYQEIILEHSKNPRNFGQLEGCTHQAEGFNPLCGDKVTVYLELYDKQIKSIRFSGVGCAISQASASLMTQAIMGKTLAEAQVLFDAFHEVMMSPMTESCNDKALGKLQVLSGVRQFPMRVKCATLAWHTFNNAINNSADIANTEEPGE